MYPFQPKISKLNDNRQDRQLQNSGKIIIIYYLVLSTKVSPKFIFRILGRYNLYKLRMLNFCCFSKWFSYVFASLLRAVGSFLNF
jgi:hypothetical protein